MPLLICRTCPRYDTANSGRFGRDLDGAITAGSVDGVRIRHVQCLGGCTEDGVVAVDGMGKARVRFNGVTPGHARAIVDAARAHAQCATGAPDDWEIPAELTDLLSTVTYKRSPRTEPGT